MCRRMSGERERKSKGIFSLRCQPTRLLVHSTRGDKNGNVYVCSKLRNMAAVRLLSRSRLLVTRLKYDNSATAATK
jgi:hypothetical protein